MINKNTTPDRFLKPVRFESEKQINQSTPDRFPKPVRCKMYKSENKPGYKLTKFGWIPEEWDECKFKDVVDISVGRDLKLDCFSENRNKDFNYPVYSNTVDNNGLYGYYSYPEYTGEAVTIVGRGVGLGTAFYKNGGFGAIGRLLVLFPKNSIDPRFLNYFINHNVRFFIESSGIPQLTGVQLANYTLVQPSLDEQCKIACILSTWDKAIEKTEQLIKAKTQLKKGLMQQLLTGKRRFREFEGEEWKEYILDNLGKTYNGLSGKNKNDFGSGYPYIPFMNIMNNSRIVPEQMDHVHIDEGEKQNRVKFGDIFFTTSSETPEEAGMPSVLLDELNETYLNSFCFGFRLNNFDKLQPSFARFYLRSYLVRKEIFKLAQGSTRYNISKNEIVKIKLLLPSLNEQLKIASFLSGLDNELIILTNTIKRYKEQKKGLMQKLLTGEVRIPPLKGEQKGDEKEGWKNRKVF